MRRIGAETRWDTLARELAALDTSAPSATIIGRDGRVLGYVGDDWTPPKSNASPTEHVDYLERAQKRIAQAVDAAKALEGQAKTRALKAAHEAAETAQGLARDVKKLLVDYPVETVKRAELARVETVSKAIDVTERAAKIGIGSWVLTQTTAIVLAAVAAYIYFEHKEPRHE